MRDGFDCRHFTEEYKSQAVGFVIDDHRSIGEVARNIGVHEMTLGKWVKKTRDDNTDPVAALTVDERSGLDRLRAENAQLHMQVEFAKKWRPGSRMESSEVCYDRGLG